MEPKVSVIVPVYRVEPYLERCVASLQEQTLKELEIILVDDGSPDNCPAICDRLAAEDARIQVIHKENQGLGMARNTGLELARGIYVSFVDSDDYVDDEMLAQLYQAAEEHQADMVLSGMRYLSADGRKNTGEQYAFFNTEVFSGEEGVKKLLLGTAGALPWEREDSRYGFSACKNLYRMSCIRESGIIFPSERKVISEDVAFLLDFIPHIRKAVGIPGTFYNYCANRDSLSKSYRPDRFQKTKFLMQEMNLRLSRFFPEEEHRLYLDRQFQAYTRVICMQEIVHARKAGFDGCVLRQRLLDISRDPELQAVLRRYPWYRLPKKQAAFAFAMRYRLIWLQRLLVELRMKK